MLNDEEEDDDVDDDCGGGGGDVEDFNIKVCGEVRVDKDGELTGGEEAAVAERCCWLYCRREPDVLVTNGIVAGPGRLDRPPSFAPPPLLPLSVACL